MRVMGFDWGKRYIGIALGDLISKQARELCSVTNTELGKTNWSEILKLINQWQPHILVIGIPWNNEHKNRELEQLALEFSVKIGEKTKLKVETIDEHLTSWQAKYDLGKFNNFSKKELTALNTKAAAIILDEWLSNQNKYE